MKIFQFILDTIIPPNPLIRAIENMDAHAFLEQAGCLTAKDMSKGVVSFFSYKSEVVRATLIEIKTYRNKKLVDLLGSVVLERLIPLAKDRPLLIPIPMTKKRLRERGWNQCELLIKAIVEKDSGEHFESCTDVLVKIRENEDQVGKSRAERFENLRGCYGIRNPEKLCGRNVIVLDDIVTTGATLEEARRALEEAGAQNVLLVSVAH